MHLLATLPSSKKMTGRLPRTPLGACFTDALLCNSGSPSTSIKQSCFQVSCSSHGNRYTPQSDPALVNLEGGFHSIFFFFSNSRGKNFDLRSSTNRPVADLLFMKCYQCIQSLHIYAPGSSCSQWVHYQASWWSCQATRMPTR